MHVFRRPSTVKVTWDQALIYFCFFASRGKKLSRERHKGIIGREHDLRLLWKRKLRRQGKKREDIVLLYEMCEYPLNCFVHDFLSDQFQRIWNLPLLPAPFPGSLPPNFAKRLGTFDTLERMAACASSLGKIVNSGSYATTTATTKNTWSTGLPSLNCSTKSRKLSSLNSSSGSILYLLFKSSKQPTLISSPESSSPNSLRSFSNSASSAIANVMSRCSLATFKTFWRQNCVAGKRCKEIN